MRVHGDTHGALSGTMGVMLSAPKRTLGLVSETARSPRIKHGLFQPAGRWKPELATSLLPAPACSSTCLHGEAALVVVAVAHGHRGLAFHLRGGDGAGVCSEIPAKVSQLQVPLSQV